MNSEVIVKATPIARLPLWLLEQKRIEYLLTWKTRIIGLLRGHWPKWWAEFRLKLWIRPWTFRGMVLKQIASERNSTIVRMVDKFEARNLCQEKSTTVLMPKLSQVTNDPYELNPELWPEEFVIKPSHGSGALVIVTKEKRPGLRYEIDLDTLDWNRGAWGMLSSELDLATLIALGKLWLSSNFEYWRPKTPEWAYGQVEPKIIVEELIAGSDGSPVIELRFHCFHGRVHITRITSVHSSQKENWTLDRSATIIQAPIGSQIESKTKSAPIPVNWDEAVIEAEKLSQGYDYVRIDLYATENGIYFSEFTPYPFGGIHDFRPRTLSWRLAKIWRTGKDLPLPKKVYDRKS